MDYAMVFSLLMKRINGRQSAYVNKLEGRSGLLWERRYKASPIQRDNYLLSCTRYVELNPVKAGIVQQPEGYRWSSFRERMSKATQYMLDEDVAMGIGNQDILRLLKNKQV